MMKSVSAAAGKSATAVLKTLQPKSVGLGEILDTWKLEQVNPVSFYLRCRFAFCVLWKHSISWQCCVCAGLGTYMIYSAMG